MADDDSRKVVPLPESWRLLLQRGARCLRDGDYGRALEAFEQAHREAPDEPQVALALGREQLRQGRYDAAERLLRRALELQPGSAAATAALARCLGLHQGKAPEAFALLHSALKACSEPAPLHVVRGELLLDSGAFLDARAAFGQAMDDPISAEAAQLGLARTYNSEGIALCERGDHEPAIFALKRAADLDPTWAGPHVNLGVVFGRMGKLGKALEAYQAALEREPASPVALFNLGTAQHELGQRKDAVHTFEELLLVAPDYPHARSALANVLGELRDFDRTIALLLEELDADGECVSCWSSLGLAYICAGNPARGEQCLLRALELDDGYFNAIHNLANLYVAQKRLDAAEELLLRAAHVDPRRTAELLATDGRFSHLRDREALRGLQPPANGQ